MANLIDNESNVKFSNINNVQLITNNKIAAAPYTLDVDGNITHNVPIINAIDIDWNDVISNEIEEPIKTTTDLIKVISNNKSDIKLNLNYINQIRSQIELINSSLENLEEEIGNSAEIQYLSRQIDAIIDNLQNLESDNSLINTRLIDLSSSISNLNNTINNMHIPKFISDLNDGYDVLRRSNFETIKDELKGESAFEAAKRIAEEDHTVFNYSTDREWIASLKGERGANGASAYDIARQTAILLGRDFPYSSEVEWIDSMTDMAEAKRYTDEKIAEINNTLQLTAGEGITIENNVIKATANTWLKL